MSGTTTTLSGRPIILRQSSFSGMTLEEEIRSLHTLLPESAAQLPVLFAESVAKACTRILGEGSGEALVRRIGDENLIDPDRSYKRIDSFLSGGSGILKEEISRGFRERVHRCYRVAMNVEARNFAGDVLGEARGGPALGLRVSSPTRTGRHPL